MKLPHPQSTLCIWCSPDMVCAITNWKSTEERVETSKGLNTFDSSTILKEN